VNLRGRLNLLIAVAALGALAALGASPASASAATETQTLGTVSASMSYDKGGLFFKNVRITISRGGVTTLDQAAPVSPACAECPPNPAFAGKSPAVHILQLDASPEPEVVFDFFTGGLHCCFYAAVFEFKGGAYSGPVQDFGDPGYELADLDGDGRFEFKSGNPGFSYAFGSFASTRFPPQVWQLQNGALVDITRSFPLLIRADIKRLRRQFKKFKSLGIKPLLAAFTADQCMLGDCGKGFALVGKAADKGFLEQPAKFRRHLRPFLKRLGYL
jgi:hypothetical protein